MDRQALGAAAEQVAADQLLSKGYRILERNWRRRWGELDIVARAPDGTVVIVEVRSRRGPDASALAAESIGPRKQRRVAELAASYLASEHPGAEARIDVITVAFSAAGRVEHVEHIENAVEGGR